MRRTNLFRESLDKRGSCPAEVLFLQDHEEGLNDARELGGDQINLCRGGDSQAAGAELVEEPVKHCDTFPDFEQRVELGIGPFRIATGIKEREDGGRLIDGVMPGRGWDPRGGSRGSWRGAGGIKFLRQWILERDSCCGGFHFLRKRESWFAMW